MIIVICSFVGKKVQYNLPNNFKVENSAKIIGNYALKNSKLKQTMYLEPYECDAFSID